MKRWLRQWRRRRRLARRGPEKFLPWPADGWPTAEQYLDWFQQQTREDQVELMAKFIRNAHEWKALGRTL